VNITFDDLIMHQAINHIGGFAIGGTDDEVMPGEVALIEKGVGTHAQIFAQILKGVVGVERVHGNAELRAITGGVELVRVTPLEFGQLQLSHEG
jgi:hypothetical protein